MRGLGCTYPSLANLDPRPAMGITMLTFIRVAILRICTTVFGTKIEQRFFLCSPCVVVSLIRANDGSDRLLFCFDGPRGVVCG
jgi:hypothetical protein